MGKPGIRHGEVAVRADSFEQLDLFTGRQQRGGDVGNGAKRIIQGHQWVPQRPFPFPFPKPHFRLLCNYMPHIDSLASPREPPSPVGRVSAKVYVTVECSKR